MDKIETNAMKLKFKMIYQTKKSIFLILKMPTLTLKMTMIHTLQ